jgi:hypothetical protein
LRDDNWPNGTIQSFSPDWSFAIQALYNLKRLQNCRERKELMSAMAKAKAGYTLAAFLSFLLSVYLWFSGHKEQGVFVGIWVPSILSFGALMLAGRGSKNA